MIKKGRLIPALLVVLAFPACGNRIPEPGPPIEAVEAFPRLRFDNPLDLQDPLDGSGRLFVVEQRGRVLVFENDPAASSFDVFLDIRDRVLSGGEQGLLGLAFDPDFADNHYFYLYYSLDGPRRTRLSRFRALPQEPNVADPASEAVILEIPQPFANHNGGRITFGPEGYLYIGVGDGGSAGDPQRNGQNRTTLLGKILRIDVSRLPYSIPPDNPFFGNDRGYRQEIFAWGLRNPWRFSFDSATGRLWAGDVGESRYEEINIIENGNNYGWSVTEGDHCFRGPCNRNRYSRPIWEYTREEGQSVTGGHVYHGSKVPELAGSYIYGDYVSGRVWALRFEGTRVSSNELVMETGLNISSFGVDGEGEIYLCAFDGKIYTLE